jgi:hypothetical protein
MPSKTPKQAKTMRAAAHNPQFAKKVGIPQSVAQDFTQADSGQDPALTVVRDSLNKDKKPPRKGDTKR